MTRPTLDEYMMALAHVASGRSTCRRRSVGCVLTDAAGNVLGIGYNGVARGLPHCNEPTGEATNPALLVVDGDGRRWRQAEHWEREHVPVYGNSCAGVNLPPGQDGCEAIHAEQNALLRCSDVNRLDTAYVTLAPCRACLKLLLGTPCHRIVFQDGEVDRETGSVWLKAGRSFVQL